MDRAFVIAIAAMATFSGSVLAESEGGRGPFEYRNPGVVTIVTPGGKRLPARGQDPFPFRGKETVSQSADPDAVLPPNGAEGIVQTANSLPLHFADGTVQYEQRLRVLAFLRSDDMRRAALLMAQQKVDAAAGHRG